MLKLPIDLSEINILFLKDIGRQLINEDIELYIESKGNDTYSIYQLPICYKGYMTDLSNNLAYNYDNLTKENQILYQKQFKHMVQRTDGFYDAGNKKYIKTEHQT